MNRLLLAFTCVMLCLSIAPAQEKFSAKSEKVAAPKELADSIQSLLDDQAVRVVDAKGEVFATFWLRKEIPSKAAAEQVKSGITYREIQETTVVGAIQFPQIWTDYRKQKIPAGVYTLRIAFQPQNGDHMGTAPYNEFCLLCPAAKDTKADNMEPKELHELSAQAPSGGGSHPSVLLLFPNSKPEDQPKVVSKPNETFVLLVKRTVDASGKKATLGFGLTVSGVTMQE